MANAAKTPVEGHHPLLPEAVALHNAGRLDDAAALYLKILADIPKDFDATHLLGVVALQQGRLEVAQRLIGAALTSFPEDVAAIGNLGTSYMRDGQLEAAWQWFEYALRLQPDSQNALTNAAMALHNMGRNGDAIPLLRKAYAADPDSYAVRNLLGVCLLKTGETHEAAELFREVTHAEPANAEGWANLSVALNALGETAEACECADRAVALKPQSPTALAALGAAQVDQGRLADAIESYRQGVALPGPSAQMLLEFGSALLASGLNQEAIEQLRRVIAMDPNNLNARWAVALAHVQPIGQSAAEVLPSRHALVAAMEDVAQWYGTATELKEPFNAVGVSQLFYLAYQPLNNRDILRRYGELCAMWMGTLPQAISPPPRHEKADRRKLRVGIASANIQDHSVWNAITRGWVHHFDPSLIDLNLFQLKPNSDGETDLARQKAAFFENRPTSLAEWVETLTNRNLDVLIYPDIGMDPLTLKLAALRLAPVQAAAWGHPETTGLPTIDLYLSADAFEPSTAQDNYSERVIRLPNLGVYVEPLEPKITNPGLCSLNLPDDEPLLLCPGSPFKYSPLYDDVWVRIAGQLRKRFLRRGSGGRLVFFRSRSDSMDQLLERRLRGAFERGGVDFDAHVSIIPSLERGRFFGLMEKSALLLDTIGFSGFNTALQGIEAGLPVLAFEGEFMRGRLASAILRRLDLPELVATTTEEFVAKAVALAGDARTRRRLQSCIVDRRRVLFHDLTPIRALEDHLRAAVGAD